MLIEKSDIPIEIKSKSDNNRLAVSFGMYPALNIGIFRGTEFTFMCENLADFELLYAKLSQVVFSMKNVIEKEKSK